jgi:hypothetical protein
MATTANTLALIVVLAMLVAFCFVAWLAMRPRRVEVVPSVIAWTVTNENRGQLPIATGRWIVKVVGPGQMTMSWIDPEQQVSMSAPVSDDRS